MRSIRRAVGCTTVPGAYARSRSSASARVKTDASERGTEACARPDRER
ncbi:hypothetical protein [Streptomyces sp. NBC_01296]|nr:hypothetical protein OG299_03035 [Streptomyces sp. NBC_01296]